MPLLSTSSKDYSTETEGLQGFIVHQAVRERGHALGADPVLAYFVSSAATEVKVSQGVVLQQDHRERLAPVGADRVPACEHSVGAAYANSPAAASCCLQGAWQ